MCPIMAHPPGPIIGAKLNMPTPRRGYIRREGLHRRLDGLAEYKAAVIRGAPGSGKTTLMAAYLAENPAIAARWISLDAGDDDVRTLWSYILAALKPDLGPQADPLRELLGAALQPGDIDTVLIELVNALQPEDHIFLVLDDAHFLTEPRVLESVQFFLRYSSEKVHLIFITRGEPHLYLGDLLMAGQLLEIDGGDLKVDAGQSRRFLEHTLGLKMSGQLLDRMTALAEGWIGGLQLLGAAYKQKEDGAGRPERAEAVASLGRPALEYLSEEIFRSLTDEERYFLVSTSILGYFDADVCRRVSGNDAAGLLLERFIGKHLLVAAVDETKGLYRYHHMFLEFLQRRFSALPADERSRLHRRAARYYRSAGNTEKGVEHFLSAGDYGGALALIGRMGGGTEGWRLLQKVPLDALEGRPDFIYQRLFSHMAEQDMEQCGIIVERFQNTFPEPEENLLFDLFAAVLDPGAASLKPDRLSADSMRDSNLSSETKVVLYSLLAIVLTLRGREDEGLACLSETDRIIGQVTNPYITYYALQFKGQVKEYMGDLIECEAVYQSMFRLAEQHPFLQPLLVNAHMSIAGVLLKSGRWAEAREHLDRVKPRAARDPAVEASYLYNEMELFTLTGHHGAAAETARGLKSFGILSSPLYRAPMLRYMLVLGVADEGDLIQFRREQVEHPSWQDRLLEARLLLRDGRAGGAGGALYIVEALLAELRKGQAKLPLVETLLLKAEVLAAAPGLQSAPDAPKAGQGGRKAGPGASEAGPGAGKTSPDSRKDSPDTREASTGASEVGPGAGKTAPDSRKASPDIREFSRDARNAVREAIHYSAENRLVAPFLLAGESVLPIIRALKDEDDDGLAGSAGGGRRTGVEDGASLGTGGGRSSEFSPAEDAFVADLIARWEGEADGPPMDGPPMDGSPTDGSPVDAGRQKQPAAGGSPYGTTSGATGPGTSLLSRREIEVMHVLAEGATNRQIARRLYISVATVKTHMVNIYSKLGVSNRVEAVEKARRWGIIGGPGE